MRKGTRNWLIAAAVLTAAGILILAAVFRNGWQTAERERITVTHEVDAPFRSICVDVLTAEVILVPAEDGSCTVIAEEDDRFTHTVSTADGVLTVKAEETGERRPWYLQLFDFGYPVPRITVSLPAGEYDALTLDSCTGSAQIPGAFTFETVDLTATTGNITCRASAAEHIRIRTTTGNIRAEASSAESMDLSVTTGDITVTDVSCTGELQIHVTTGETFVTDAGCGSFTSEGNTGDLLLRDFTAEALCSVRRSTGDVIFEDCDAGELSVETNTGSVTGTLRTAKCFITETATGDVRVPQTAEGGICRIETGTGDIRISISQ